MKRNKIEAVYPGSTVGGRERSLLTVVLQKFAI
jgi:hypothetical protein